MHYCFTVQYYRFIHQSSKATIDPIAHQILEELNEIWKKAKIPTAEFRLMKKQIKTVIERGKKYVSKKLAKNSKGKGGYHNEPGDCCIISMCRCFTKSTNVNDIGKTNLLLYKYCDLITYSSKVI